MQYFIQFFKSFGNNLYINVDSNPLLLIALGYLFIFLITKKHKILPEWFKYFTSLLVISLLVLKLLGLNFIDVFINLYYL